MGKKHPKHDKHPKPRPGTPPPAPPTVPPPPPVDIAITDVYAEGCPNPGPPAPPGCIGDAVVVCPGHNFSAGSHVQIVSLQFDLRGWVGNTYQVASAGQDMFKLQNPDEDQEVFTWDNLINRPNAGVCRSAEG